jgi:hypothetical protein
VDVASDDVGEALLRDGVRGSFDEILGRLEDLDGVLGVSCGVLILGDISEARRALQCVGVELST